jgi:hypothetical protein
MPKKASKLALLADQIAVARRIIEGQQTLLEKLRIKGEPTREAEGALRTYEHLLAHEDKIKNAAKAKKGETRKKKAKSKPRHRSPSRRLAFRQPE